MTAGYDQPLYILPFDHRHSYGSEVFGYHEPMTRDQIADVAASKRVIFDGFQKAVAGGAPKAAAGILVDEEFGADVLRDAVRQQFVVAVSVEKSGQHEFDFEYGDDFAQHIKEFNPTFAKVLVRYNPEGDRQLNQRQALRLKQISDYLAANGPRFMFELLVPPEKSQLQRLGGDSARFDREARPGLVVTAIHELQKAGVEPDVWKIEGLEARADCEQVAAAARRNGRDKVGCIVLGRGESESKVIEWLSIAAPVPGFIGFAVGRSTFLEAIQSLRKQRFTRQQAIDQIAERYRKWVDVYQSATKGKRSD